MERLEASKAGESATLIGQFGVGFYSAFMVADRVDVVSRRAGSSEAWRWSSDGKGTYTVEPADAAAAPARGTRVTLHLMEDAKSYTERFNIERIVRANSGHVPVPISIVEKPGAEPAELADGVALWTRPRSEIKPEEYTDFYRSVAGQFDEPALTVHFRAEGRHEFTALAFVPSAKPFDLYDPGRKSRMKLYVKRVFITDDAEILPHYLRFVRGIVDSADLPLSLSREMIQTSPILGAIKKSVTGRVLSELEKLADSDAEAYGKIWDVFGPVLKEGIYEDYERTRRAAEAGALPHHRTAVGRAAQPQGLCRGAQAQPDRDLLHRRRQPRPDRGLAASRRLPRPRRRGAAAVRHRRQPVGHLQSVVRRQAVPLGDAGRGRSRADPAARRQGRRRSPKPTKRSPISSPS